MHVTKAFCQSDHQFGYSVAGSAAQIFPHRRGSRTDILSASMTASLRARRLNSSRRGSISDFLAKLFSMHEHSAEQVGAYSVMKGDLEMHRKRSNTWKQVYCILDREGHLYIFEAKDSLRSIHICPLAHAKIIGAWQPECVLGREGRIEQRAHRHFFFPPLYP